MCATVIISSSLGNEFPYISAAICLIHSKATNMAKVREDISSIIAHDASIVGATGITTYLKMTMQCNTPFRVVVKSVSGTTGKNQRQRGLSRGRVSDHLFRKIVAGSAKLDANDPLQKSLCYVFRLLGQHRVRVTTTQTAVSDQELKVKTNLDGLGIFDNKMVCVFELKTTTHTLAEHVLRYNTQCSNRPTLSNGLPNTERTMHALQTGFGMMCCQNIIQKPVCGCVVVACTDGAKLYWVENSFTIRELFLKGNKNYLIAAPKPFLSKIKFLELPAKESPIFTQIHKLLKRQGYETIVKSKTSKYSALASTSSKNGSFIAIVGIMSNTVTKQTEQKHKQLLSKESLRHYNKHKQKINTTAYLCIPQNKTFTLVPCCQMNVAK